MNLGWDKNWKRLRIVSKGCHWISPKTNFGNALQHFWYHANEFGLGDNSKTSWNNFNRVQTNFGWDTIWNVLEKFQKDAIEFCLTHVLEMPYNLSGTMQMILG